MQCTQDSDHVTTDEGVIQGNVDQSHLENVGSGVLGCGDSSVTGPLLHCPCCEQEYNPEEYKAQPLSSDSPQQSHRRGSAQSGELFVLEDPYDTSQQQNPVLSQFSSGSTDTPSHRTVNKPSRRLLIHVYSYFLLYLPSIYFSRVSRILQEEPMTDLDMKELTEYENRVHGEAPRKTALKHRFKVQWEEFIDGLLREYKTLNLVSALLLTALVSMFQIDSIINQPTTRTAALVSLVCALWSLMYGGTYVIRFGTMRSRDKALKWLKEARRTGRSILWNVWVLHSLPAVWLAWSMISFVIAVLSFVWTTGAQTDQQFLPTDSVAIVLRVIVTVLMGLGFAYFILAIRTFRRYAGFRRSNGTSSGGSSRSQDTEVEMKERGSGFVNV